MKEVQSINSKISKISFVVAGIMLVISLFVVIFAFITKNLWIAYILLPHFVLWFVLGIIFVLIDKHDKTAKAKLVEEGIKCDAKMLRIKPSATIRINGYIVANAYCTYRFETLDYKIYSNYYLLYHGEGIDNLYAEVYVLPDKPEKAKVILYRKKDMYSAEIY